MIHHINKLKETHNRILSIDAEKQFNILSHVFKMKPHSKLELKGSFLFLATGVFSQVSWHTAIILATREAQTGRLKIQGHPRQKVVARCCPKNKMKATYGSSCL
jgi:hypothetical protein